MVHAPANSVVVAAERRRPFRRNSKPAPRVFNELIRLFNFFKIKKVNRSFIRTEPKRAGPIN